MHTTIANEKTSHKYENVVDKLKKMSDNELVDWFKTNTVEYQEPDFLKVIEDSKNEGI